MIRCYLSGPMTGLPDLNFPAFHDAAAQLRLAGFEVVNPAEINADGGDWQACMRRDIAELMTCDRIVTLPGWTHSKGAKIEVALGCVLGMDVSELDHMLTQSPVVMGGSPA